MAPLQKRIRDLERLIKKHGLTPELQQKRELLEKEQKGKKDCEKERKFAEKYHMVRYIFKII